MLFNAPVILPSPNTNFSAINGSPYGLSRKAIINAITPKDVHQLQKKLSLQGLSSLKLYLIATFLSPVKRLE